MKTVYKYVVPVAGPNVLHVPDGARLLHVGAQESAEAGNRRWTLCVWALVDTDVPVLSRTLFVCGTGWELPAGPFDFLGTAICGPLVWHVWEAK